MYHRGTGLDEVRRKYMRLVPTRVAHEVLHRCRSRLAYFQRLRVRHRRREAKNMMSVIREAERQIEGAPQLAMERIRRALRRRKAQGGNAAMQRVFRRDDPDRGTVGNPLEVPVALG